MSEAIPDWSAVFADLVYGKEPVLGAGVRGVQVFLNHGIYIPAIRAETPGRGDVGRFLDGLPKGCRVVFPAVISAILEGMLRRRGFTEVTYVDGSGHVQVDMVRVPFFERPAGT